ncbi:hypothetical protein EST38_g8481 [Candolleomyces aberdarensis]|uniref:TauD/TfdA-like domain-containing protein n=1 Tax=Candolleomyces aberdarensis TaxID=2316362 RepID=A0A4Q2DFU7_9AGAR|nr:hypothetical protein EST38_g8481 [Candolleomyces aberdarensis]
MAPSVAETETSKQIHPAAAAVERIKDSLTSNPNSGPSYPAYLPTFDVSEKFPPLELFEHSDPGLRANPAKPNLLNENAKLKHISPYLGTEIRGVQISQLSKEGLDELALLTAERKVLVFRDQDFKDIGIERQIEIAKYFGPIHRHPTSGNVKGYPEFHVVYRDPEYDDFKEYAINDGQW